MSKTLVRVFTQYHDENGKPKGGQEFELRVDDDYFLYGKEQSIDTISKMLLEYGNNRGVRYTYLDHELVFHASIELDSDVFEKLFKESHGPKGAL